MPNAPVSSKLRRTALTALSRDSLTALTGHYELDGFDRRAAGNHVDALIRSRSVDFADLLGRLSRDELKAVCEALDLPAEGREKQLLVDRILTVGDAPAASSAVGPSAPPPKTNGKPGRASDRPPAALAVDPAKKRNSMSDPNLSSFIWSVADLLRGDYKQSEYGKVILPFTVLRRLDCVLESTKDAVLAELATRKKAGVNPEPFLLRKSGQLFFNTSPLDLKKLMGDQDHIGENLRAYLQAFSPAVRDIFESFEFHTQIDRLEKAGLLYLVTEKFANIDLHPTAVSNAQMGAVFEELIRKFAELSNETAGEHFTPREVIRLMVNLLFIEDDDALTKPGVVRSIYDPTAGTGGMLSVAGEHLASLNPNARLVMYGQELNAESYAICKADMLIKGQDIANIVFGNTLSADGLGGKLFDYMLSNPPFGVEWKKIEKDIRKEAEQMGFNGRFGPGLPRVSDGSLLFLLHLISKMRPAVDGGSRFGIVLNGSPLFTGGAGSGESEIRRYVLENDLVEAIIGLPTDMFYNTGISTYVWIVSNRKPAARKGKLQLIDASGFWQKMRKSLGSKRKELSTEHHRGDHAVVRQLHKRHQWRRAHQPHLQERRLRLPHDHGRAPRARSGREGRARHQGQRQRSTRAQCRAARHGERAAERRREDLLRARGAAACTGCVDRHREDQGRLRDPVQPTLLRVQAAAAAERDRRRAERCHGPDSDDDRGAVEVSGELSGKLSV